MTQDKVSEAIGLCPLDGDPGPAAQLSETDRRALVERIVARTLDQDRLPSIPMQRPARWLLAAAVLAVVSGAVAAGSWVAVPLRQPELPASASVSAVAQAPTPTTPRRWSAKPRPSDQPAPSAAPTVTTQRPAPRPVKPSSPPPAASAVQPPEDLLLEANRLRGQGQWAEADRAYARVMRLHPGSRDAYVATLASASLRLEQLGDPSGALQLYQSVMGRGSLAEEALYGVARCHRAQGNTAAEAQALRSLLAAYPGSVRRQRAEQRLMELGETFHGE